MVLSYKTQQEMYDYISGTSHLSVKDANTETELLKLMIIDLISYLNRRNELFTCRIRIEEGDNFREQALYKYKNFKNLSNALIYRVIKQLGIKISLKEDNCSLEREKISRQLEGFELDNIDEVPESGSNKRKELIKYCKLYLENLDMDSGNRGNDIELAKESFLFERAMAKYCKELFKGCGARVLVQKSFKNGSLVADNIKPDIIIIKDRTLIVIDCKVYDKILIKNKKGIEIYGYNSNRFQVNSYLGKCLQEYKVDNCIGILLHAAKDCDEHKYQENDLTIEDDRPIKLMVIKDAGWYNMMEEFKIKIDEVI